MTWHLPLTEKGVFEGAVCQVSVAPDVASFKPDERQWPRIDEKKAALDALRPLAGPTLAALDAWYDVELTYTSNALEGTQRERPNPLARPKKRRSRVATRNFSGWEIASSTNGRRTFLNSQPIGRR